MTAFVIFAGIELQRELESLAYKMGGGNNNAPAQLVGDFLQGAIASVTQRGAILSARSYID